MTLQTIHKVREERPANMDVRLFVVIRYEWDSDDPSDVKQFYLTTTGWREYRGYDVFDLTGMPQMTGADFIHEAMVQHKLDAMVDNFLRAVRERDMESRRSSIPLTVKDPL